MAKFKVLNCVTEVTYIKKVINRDKSGKTASADLQVTEKVTPGFYGVENVKAGDVIEIKDNRLVEKARNNADLEEVKPGPKKAK